jgi:hypothetical protein
MQTYAFTLSVDSTTDITTNDQAAFMISYFNPLKCKAQTFLYDINDMHETNAQSYFSHIQTNFDCDKIPWDTLIAFSSDGAANMDLLYEKLLTRSYTVKKLGCICHELNLIAQHSITALSIDVTKLVNDAYSLF